MAILYDGPFWIFGPIPASIQIIVVGGILTGIVLEIFSILSPLLSGRPVKGFPVVALEGRSEIESWHGAAAETISHGLSIHEGRPFQVISNTGAKIVLPNRYADEIKNNPQLSLGKSLQVDFFHQYRGFEPFALSRSNGGEDFLATVVRTKLTPALGLVIPELVDETTQGVEKIFGDNTEWQPTMAKPKLLDLVARLSSRVFLGRDLCRNERWLEIARDYTVHVFFAAQYLRTIHPYLRAIKQYFAPPCIQLRKDVKDAEAIIIPEIERRKATARKAVEAGEKMPKKADTISWMYKVAEEKSEDINYVTSQLALNLAAIDTTAESLMQALIDLISHPEVIQALRDEIVEVIGKQGWTKTGLYKLHLMDSFLKESQRFHPTGCISMTRAALSPVPLSSGEILPTGSRVMIATSYLDPTIYPDPLTFNAWRFLPSEANPNKTQGFITSKANSNSHVSVSPAMPAFGYGVHACPGRFFDNFEMKIALAVLLVKYDWRLVIPGGPAGEGPTAENPMAPPVKAEQMRGIDEARNFTFPHSMMEMRRRMTEEQEVDLDCLAL